MRCRSLALVLVALALALPGGASSLSLPASSPLEPALLVLPAGAVATTAIPLAAPMPTGATGLGPGTYLLSTIEGSVFICTANWVWSAGGALYLGAAGHCFLPADKTATHGGGRDYDASGIRVRACVSACDFAGGLDALFTGQTVDLGPVAYARQTRGGMDIGNDFGLVRIPDALAHLVRPAMPVWGSASGARDVRPGDVTCLYGHGIVVGEAYLTKARAGTGIAAVGDGSWRAAMPSAMGDSGSAVATCAPGLDGTLHADRAIGVLTHLSPTGVAGTTMGRATEMAAEAGLTLTPVFS